MKAMEKLTLYRAARTLWYVGGKRGPAPTWNQYYLTASEEKHFARKIDEETQAAYEKKSNT